MKLHKPYEAFIYLDLFYYQPDYTLIIRMGIFDAKEVHIFGIFRYFILHMINVYNAGDTPTTMKLFDKAYSKEKIIL